MLKFISLILLLAFSAATWAQGAIPWEKVQAYNSNVQPAQLIYQHPTGLTPSLNPARFAMRSAMYLYQHHITYQLPSSCMYEPSCSEFSRQCFETFGPVKALFLSMDRLSRCNRFEAIRRSQYDLISGETRVKYADPVERYHFGHNH